MIPLYVVNASGATILSLDEPAIDTDQGAAFTASATSVAHTPLPPAGAGKLRRVVQAVSISTSATLTLQPIVDGNPNANDVQTFSLTSIVDGANPTLEARTANQGSRFQVTTAITAHVGPCELAEAEQWVRPKMSSRGN